MHINDDLVPWLIVLFAIVAGAGITDVVLDINGGISIAHLVVELVFGLAALAITVFLAVNWLASERRLRCIQLDQQKLRAFIDGLNEIIENKFLEWHLTPVEIEVGTLLLKGLSHSDIAANSGRSERTIRQHAVSIYRKAGLKNRAELSAYFLEDLLLAADCRADQPTPPNPSPGQSRRTTAPMPARSVDSHRERLAD